MGTTIEITYGSSCKWMGLPLSNSAAEAVICALVVAGSREIIELLEDLKQDDIGFADFQWEIDLLTFLASHDRLVLGNSEGFDIGRLGWSKEKFDEQKKTLLGFVDMAILKSSDYIGNLFNTERLLPNLGAVRVMILNMTETDIPAKTELEWPIPPPKIISWYYTVIRGDIHFIEIGERVNIQDLCMVHVTGHKFPTVIGNDITVGHRAVLHGCIVEDRCLIGIGSVVLDGARIGPDCLVAAHSLVPPGFQATPGTLIVGSPAKCTRPLRHEELEMIETTKANYIEYARRYRANAISGARK